MTRPVVRFACGLALALFCVGAEAGDAKLDQWLGKSPLTIINGQNIFEAAGLTDPQILNDYERAASTRWSAVQSAQAHFTVFGTQFPRYGYEFAECAASSCSLSAPSGIFFLSFNGPDWHLFYGGKKAGTNLNEYCSYGDSWACNTAHDKLPSGSANAMAQAVSERFEALSPPEPIPHQNVYGQCLDEHNEAYCQWLYNNSD